MTPEELTEARKTIGSDCQESDLVCAIQEAGQSLLAHIDQQAKQIEALKEMLVSMTTTAIWKASYDSLTGKYTISDADAEKMARQQLKADPDLQKAGVAWDE